MYLGNDLDDLPVIVCTDFSILSSDAHAFIKFMASAVLHQNSGDGYMRIVVGRLLDLGHKTLEAINSDVFDFAVDIRRSSPNFGKWEGCILSAENRRMLWIPPGFAHGFLVLSDTAELLYKTTDYWAPDHERCIIWNDPDLAINWHLTGEPILSPKDKLGHTLPNAELYQRGK